MIYSKFLLMFYLTFALTTTLLADTAVLKDGKVVQGTFKGGSATAIQFESDGKIQEIPLANVTTLTFSPREAAPAATGAAAPAAAAATPKQGPATIPAGTPLMIRLTQAVGTAKDKEGSAVKAVLDQPVVIGGQTVLPAETPVFGKVTESRGGRVMGGIKLMIQFSQVSVEGQMITVALDPIGAEAGRGGAAKKVGAGALVGAAFGGAGEGAAIGGAAAILSARNNHIEIPAGTIAQLNLEQQVEIP
jgi:hypothetical protein